MDSSDRRLANPPGAALEPLDSFHGNCLSAETVAVLVRIDSPRAIVGPLHVSRVSAFVSAVLFINRLAIASGQSQPSTIPLSLAFSALLPLFSLSELRLTGIFSFLPFQHHIMAVLVQVSCLSIQTY